MLPSKLEESAKLFVKDVVFESRGGIAELLNAPYAYADPSLAPLYGKSLSGTGFQKRSRRFGGVEQLRQAGHEVRVLSRRPQPPGTFGKGVEVLVGDTLDAESIAKALVFLPMAISFVGASIIWRFVYAFRPQESDQIGLLNAVWRGLGGAVLDPLQARPWNTFFLIIVLIWGQTGFAMVVLSSAIKAVPDDYIEAARVDGATESQIFWRIILPQIRSTILVVVTTLIILVMKVFDIVKVMTNGEFGTNVIANEMFDQAFRFGNVGWGAALASVLFLAVLPVMYINIRRVREEAEL